MKIRFEIKLIVIFVLVIALTTLLISILSRHFITQNFAEFCNVYGNELPRCLRDEAGQTFLRSVNTAMIISSSTAVVFAIILSIIVTRTLLKPLKSIILASRQFASGSYDTRIQIKTRDEFDQLIDEINKLFKQVENQDLLRKNLIANFSHEISTPLTNIYGYIEALEDKIITKPEEVKIALRIIKNDTEQVIKLSKETKELALLESNEYVLKKEKIRLDELIKEVEESLDLLANSKNIKITTDLIKVTIDGDPSKLKQAIANVIKNAIIYSKARTKVNVILNKSDSEALIVVQDEGIGIIDEELIYVFDRFYRGNNVRSKYEGSGIGLSITKNIVEKHRGNINISSVINEGTTVRIYLPLDNINT